MALAAAAGSHGGTCMLAAGCPLAHAHAVTAAAATTRTTLRQRRRQAPSCLPFSAHAPSPTPSPQPHQPGLLAGGCCRCQPTRRTATASFGSRQPFRPGASPGGSSTTTTTASSNGATAAPCCRHGGSARLPPPAASGAVPSGPTGRPSSQPQGAASASGHPFNPRYNHHHYHPQPGQQAPPHSHAHPHQHPHAHQPGSAAGRGAWATPGPLAPGGGAQSGLNPRYESPSAPQPLRPVVPSSPPLSRPQLQEESRLVSAGAASPGLTPAPAGTAAAAAAMSVTAAARQPPRHGPRSGGGPSVPYEPQQPGEQPTGEQRSRQQQQPQYHQTGEGRGQGGGERTQLERLFIKDFALVSEQIVRLGPGVNVITGESGSGKSVLVEAFSQVLGAPAPQECVRAPAEMAVVEGTFLVGEEQRAAVVQLMASCGLPQRALSPLAGGENSGGVGAGASARGSTGGGDGGSGGAAGRGGGFRLTVRREISQAPAGGLRSRVFLNGSPSSLRVLRELGALLVDTNGQHSAMSLRDSATQLELLDRIAGTSPLAESYRVALTQLRQLEGRLDELDELDDEQERATMQKLVDAVAKLRVQPGEERELRRTLKKMEARRVAVEQCGLVRMALCGEAGAGGVTDALRTIEAQLNAILAQEEQNRAPSTAAAAAAATAAGKGGPKGAAAGEDEAGEEGEEGEEEGEEGGGGSGGAAAGARMMEDALEQVATAKDMLAAAENMVRSYARRYQFSQADHDATAERLARIERLMKQASAAGFGTGAGGGVGRGVGRGGGSRIVSSEQLLEVAEECSAKLAAYYEMEGQREEWEAQLQSLVGELRTTALQLSSRRRAAAAALRSAVEGCLRELAMGGSRFDVRIGWAEERVGALGGPEGGAGGGGAAVAAEGLYVSEEEAEEAGVSELGGRTYFMGPRGLDQVEFLLAAGPAEPLRPLAAVASGGESARVMLALKAAPAQALAAAAATAAAANQGSAQARSEPGPDGQGPASPMAGGGVPIMILDELDSGIGARLGSAVGSILARMALPTHGSNSQIICVTHLPQVACYAAHHIKVQKELPAASAPHAAAVADAPHPPEQGDGGAAAAVPRPPQPAAAAAARVTTSFVPLTSFEARCEEVAAMLGLDRGVAEEMLRSAQSQVVAMYPPGSPPPDGFSKPQAPTSAQRGSAGGPNDEAGDDGDDGPGARAAAVRRVVQDALRGGGDVGRASSGFSVVVSPAMDPNAVLVAGGGEGLTTAAAGGSGGGVGDSGGEDGGEEAELSAQLLAGVEAAAMQHLQRMEAQAKAAAAAAAAAAAIVAPQAVAAEAAAAAGMWVALDVAAVDVSVVGLGDGPEDAVQRVGGPSDSARAAASWVAGQAEPATASVTMAGAAAAAGPLAGAEPGLGSRSSPDFGSSPAPGGVRGSSLEVVVELVESSSSIPADPSGPASSSAGDGNSSSSTTTIHSDAGGSGFVVAVQPSRSPLPYDFGGGDADAQGDADAESATRGGGGERLDNRPDRDSTIAYDMYDMYDAEHRARHQQHASEYDQQYEAYNIGGGGVAYDNNGNGAQVYGMTAGSYTFGVAGGGVNGSGAAATSAAAAFAGGGRFVAVPIGQEVEFQEMFKTIMSFTREDYAGEAVRTYEAVLTEALRDAGLA